MHKCEAKCFGKVHACLTYLFRLDRGYLYRWIGNQSLCCSVEYERPMTAYNYSTHRKQLFAFPARTTHSALVAGARWRPLLWTVLVCSIFTLTHKQPHQTLNQSVWLYEVIIDVSSEAALKQQWFQGDVVNKYPGAPETRNQDQMNKG